VTGDVGHFRPAFWVKKIPALTLIGCFLYHFVGTVDIVDGHINAMLDSIYIVRTVVRIWFHKNTFSM
jgi:hypothetical protein